MSTLPPDHVKEIVNELQIIFIYDRLSCKREEDDPSESILYFHPPEIPEEKRVAICGQLMGVTHFLLDAFSPPKILTLANGKFALRTFGKQYVLALGCSTATPDWFLDKQADILYQLTRFFHSDIQSVLSRVDGDRVLLSKKLTTMMEHYIPISQRHGDLFALTFGILPILYLPKTANGISIQASLILQTCLMRKGVLGGMVMYQNKVVAVELGQDLAQKLAFIQPYRMPPADTVKVDFKLPMGVQLLIVYMTKRDMEELVQNSARFQQPSTNDQHFNNNIKKDRHGLVINSIREESPSDMSSNISSIALTEDLFSGTQVEVDVVNGSFILSPVKERDVVDELRKEVDLGQFPKNIPESSPTMRRKFQSMTENPIAHLSCQHLKTNVPGLNKTCYKCQSSENLYSNAEKEQMPNLQKCSSLCDPVFPFVRCDGKSMSHFLVTALAEANTEDSDNEVEKESLDDSHVSSSSNSDDETEQTNDCSTLPKSELVEESTSTLNPKSEPEQSSSSKISPIQNSSINFVSTPSSIRRPMDLAIPKVGTPLPKKKLWTTIADTMSPEDESQDSQLPIIEVHNKVCDAQPSVNTFRKKPPDHSPERPTSNHSRYFNTFRKLSSREDDSSSYSSSDQEKKYSSVKSPEKSRIQSSEDTTENKWTPQRSFGGRPKRVNQMDQSDEPYSRAAIFMYCFGTMRLLIVLDPLFECDSELINTLWGYGSSSIIDLKEAVTSVEEQSQFSNQNDPYCFLRYESVWKSLAHGGRNEVMDFNTVQLMHRDFTSFPNIHELIIRGEDHVVYGYQCVGSEVYYQQSAGLQPGLPMPSDLMGKVPQKAKRRLERDHSILIL